MRSVIKWDLLPKSDAKNSYDLLNDVIDVIREEPKRIYMDEYVRTTEFEGRNAPACGTQGCIAGWLAILKSDQRLLKTVVESGRSICTSFNGKLSYNFEGVYYGEGAATFSEKFIPRTLHSQWTSLTLGYSPYTWPDSTPGTQEYADGVIKNIKLFQKTHKATLKAFEFEE